MSTLPTVELGVWDLSRSGFIEIPFVFLILLDGDRFTRFEAFDENQRDLALARFQEFGQA